MGFQQGLSGLNAASRNLDVIGNNIANANTVGMKTSRAEFADLYAASVGGSGGTGLGVTVAAVTQQFTQGNVSVTGNGLDVAINGNGFFQLQQLDKSFAYTRAGNFKLDAIGGLVTQGGASVMGIKRDPGTGNLDGVVGPLSPLVRSSVPAQVTTKIEAVVNLDARTEPAVSTAPPTPRSTYGTSVNVYDPQGVSRPVNLYFVKTIATPAPDTPNTWQVFDSLVSGSPLGTVQFGGNGELLSTNPAPLTVTVSPAPANPNNPPAPFPVNISLRGSTQFGDKFSVSALKQDGYASGNLAGINIANDGRVMASYSNGVTSAEARLALANFSNPQGLAPGGGNLWTETSQSGPRIPGTPGDGNLGMLRSGALEDSNVDLTSELVNMMVAQRSYQANAQTIKTQDQVLSTLLNMR
jgi:flagellar hook protein FlgE